jgi:hypothetical protein
MEKKKRISVDNRIDYGVIFTGLHFMLDRIAFTFM